MIELDRDLALRLRAHPQLYVIESDVLKVDFSKLSITLKPAVGDTPAVVIQYGEFLNSIIAFLIVAFCIFMIIKLLKSIHMKKDLTPDASPQEILLAEIRDILKERP